MVRKVVWAETTYRFVGSAKRPDQLLRGWYRKRMARSETNRYAK